MDRTALPPMVIFKGKKVNPQWLPDNTPSDWILKCSSKGWTNNELMKEWLLEDFEVKTRDKAEGRTRLLIFNGHVSHTTSSIIRHCILNNIQLALLPPHSSHLTFGCRSFQFSETKYDWRNGSLFSHWHRSDSERRMASWCDSGLQPFNPLKVLGRIPPPLPVNQPARGTTPEAVAPFANPDLTSSPIDTPALRAANSAITQLAHDRNAVFNIPAR